MDTGQIHWRKSSYSGGANNCVEVADLDDRIAIRDSKNLDQSPLLFPRSALAAFLAAVKQGDFDQAR